MLFLKSWYIYTVQIYIYLPVRTDAVSELLVYLYCTGVD